MSIQEKIANALSPLQRKLFDQHVNLMGSEHKVIRLKVTVDRYDTETVDIISDDIITVILDIPTEIPLYRLRGESKEQIDSTTGLYLYDILPIEGYSKFEDNVEKFDIIIKKIYDDVDSTDPMLMILRISEVLGSLNANNLVWKKFYCAPYNLRIGTSLQALIDEYKDSGT
jgi:hypothetical protein